MVDSPGAMDKPSAVPELQPLHQYDFSRAKICASVRWLLAKWYGSAGTSLREAAWVGRLIIPPFKCLNPSFRESVLNYPDAAPSLPPLSLQPQCSVEVIADEGANYCDNELDAVRGGEGGLTLRDCVMHARVADSVIAAAQRSLCQSTRPGDASRCMRRMRRCWRGWKWVKAAPEYWCQCYARTHARTRGWSAGPSAGGGMLDNGESAAAGFLAKKFPKR